MSLKSHKSLLFFVCALFIACGGKPKQATKVTGVVNSFDSIPVPSTLVGLVEFPNGNDGTLAQTWADTILPGQGPELNKQYLRVVDDGLAKMVTPTTNVDHAKALRVMAVQVPGKDGPEPVLMAHKLGELTAKVPGNVIAPLSGNVFLAGDPKAVAVATPFAQKLSQAVKTHRLIVYPQNALNTYKSQIDKMLRRISIKSNNDAPKFATLIELYLNSLISLGGQLKRIDATLMQSETTINIDTLSVEGTNVEKFFLAQTPSNFGLANRVPTDRPFYLESEWHMGDAEAPLTASLIEMMTAIDDTANWTIYIGDMIRLITGKNVGSFNIKPNGKIPEFDYIMGYENTDDTRTFDLLKKYMNHFANSKKWEEMTTMKSNVKESKTKNGTPYISYHTEMGKVSDLLGTYIFSNNKMLYQVLGKNAQTQLNSLTETPAFNVAPNVKKALDFAKSQSANSLLYIDAKSIAGGVFPLELKLITKGVNGDLKAHIELARQP